MRAFVVASGVRIDPFGELACELPIGGRPWTEARDALLTRFGLEVSHVERIEDIESDGPCLVTFDNVFFTRRVLKSFLAGWNRSSGGARLALPLESGFVEQYSDLQDYEAKSPHALYRFFGAASVRPGTGLEALASSCAPLPVVYKERTLTIAVPSHVVGFEAWNHPVTSSICLHLEHWIHILHANLLSIQVRWVDQVVGHPIWTLSRALMAAFPGRGRYMDRLAKRANVIGRNVRIHPTALVEGSFIGDGTVIGPQATIRGSIIGKDVHIDQRADITFSVLGDRCFVSKHSIANATVSLEHSDLCAKGIQMSLLGRRVGLGARVNLMDTMPGGKIKVMTDEGVREIEAKVMGCCVGHDAWLGPDIYVAPGRSIPNGTRMTMSPERILSRIPDPIQAGQLYVVRNGTLERP